jgi:hypothetical protein
MEPLTTEEVDVLFATLCEPAPTYSDKELETFCNLSDFVPNRNLNVKHLPYINLLDFALRQPSGHLLKILDLHVIFDNTMFFYYIYVYYTHYDLYHRKFPQYQMVLSRIIDCLIKFGQQEIEPLLSLGLVGVREDITYRMQDFYNYVHPELFTVQKLVPAHFTVEKALQIYHDHEAYTWSYNGMQESRHYYDKDENILTYLQTLSN